MPLLSYIRCLLLVLLFFSFVLNSDGKGGRGGGGSRGGGRSSGGGWSSSRSYSSSSRSSSSPSKSSSSYDFSSSVGSSSSFSFKPPSSTSVKDHSLITGDTARSIQSANYPRQSYIPKPLASPATSLFPGIPNANYPRQPMSSNTYASSQGTFPKVGIQNANYPSNPFISPQSLSSQGGIKNANHPVSSNPFSLPTSSFSQGIPLNASYPKLAVSSQGGISNANYPRQPMSSNYFLHSHSSSLQGGHLPNINYPRQPSSNPFFQSPSAQGGIPNSNYPRQPSSNPFFQSPSAQGAIPNSNYPRQHYQTSGNSQPQGLPTVTFPRQGIIPNPGERVPVQVQPRRTSSFHNQPSNDLASANYPRQRMSRQKLGSGVWNPKSGMSAPVYMNYGGLPTGVNMYTRPLKKKGFLGSLISYGCSGKPYKNKRYRSYPSPYGIGGGIPSDVLGSFMGNKGSKKAMYTILPYMASRKAPKIFKPKFRFYSYRPIRYYSHGYYSHLHDTEFSNVRYDVYNNDYVGRCNSPITPDHAKIICNSTHNQVDCEVTCKKGYRFTDGIRSKSNKCWHASGVWNPTKNFPACEPVCSETCLNGGKCVSPGVCGCTSEYRGLHCEFHFLNCDIRKLAKDLNIRWVCTHFKNETRCRVKCKSPEQFATPSEALYKCTPEGVWTPSDIPMCVTPDSEERSVSAETR